MLQGQRLEGSTGVKALAAQRNGPNLMLLIFQKLHCITIRKICSSTKIWKAFAETLEALVG